MFVNHKRRRSFPGRALIRLGMLAAGCALAVPPALAQPATNADAARAPDAQVALGCQQLVSAVAQTGGVVLQGLVFDDDGATLQADSVPALLAARDAILTLTGDWQVHGPAGTGTGSEPDNQRLSLARAQAVVDWLYGTGIPTQWLAVAAPGDGQLTADTLAGSDHTTGTDDITAPDGSTVPAGDNRITLTASYINTEALGFGGPADVEAEGCAGTAVTIEDAPALLATLVADGGEDTGHYCPVDALPCRFEDAETGLAFLLLPGFNTDFPYFYETAGGARATLPSLSLYRISDTALIGALNPRQWSADLGPCREGPAGLSCQYAPRGTEPADSGTQLAFDVFVASLTLQTKE